MKLRYVLSLFHYNSIPSYIYTFTFNKKNKGGCIATTLCRFLYYELPMYLEIFIKIIPTQSNVMPMIVKTTRPTIRLANNTSIMNMTINAITDPMPMQQISRDLSISLLSLFIISTILSLILEKGYGVGSSPTPSFFYFIIRSTIPRCMST